MGCASAVRARATRLNQQDTNGEHPCQRIASSIRQSRRGIKVPGQAYHIELIGYPCMARQGLIFANVLPFRPQQGGSALSSSNADPRTRRCDLIGVGFDPGWPRLHDSLAALPGVAKIVRSCLGRLERKFEIDPVWPARRQPADRTDIQKATTPEQETPKHGQRSREKRAAPRA